jgi:hypothetical protein
MVVTKNKRGEEVSMSHQPVTHLSVAQSGRRSSADMVCARLFGVDVQRPKRIDRQIDYFGSGERRPIVNGNPRGGSALDAALSRFLRMVAPPPRWRSRTSRHLR